VTFAGFLAPLCEYAIVTLLHVALPARTVAGYVIDPATHQVVDRFKVGLNPQHVVPSWDLQTLWVANNAENTRKGSLTPIRRWGMPEEVGKTVVSLATGALPYTIGQVINVDGGLLAFRL